MGIEEVVKSKNPEDVTEEELRELEILIEETQRKVDWLQHVHRELTGKDYMFFR